MNRSFIELIITEFLKSMESVANKLKWERMRLNG